VKYFKGARFQIGSKNATPSRCLFWRRRRAEVSLIVTNLFLKVSKDRTFLFENVYFALPLRHVPQP
jgi:hypothetical protein